jgi:hypothetical protein
MRKSVIIGLLLLTAGLFGVATTLNIIISHAMAQGYYDDNSYSQYPTGAFEVGHVFTLWTPILPATIVSKGPLPVL